MRIVEANYNYYSQHARYFSMNAGVCAIRLQVPGVLRESLVYLGPNQTS